MLRPFPALVLTTLLFVGVVGGFWLGQPPSNQELLANYAKVENYAQIAGGLGGIPWWTPDYLQGSSLSFLAFGALTNLLLYVGALVAGPFVGGKLVALACWALAPLTMYGFVRRLCPSSPWTAFSCGIAYLCAPPVLLRLGHPEHVAVVLAFAMLPAAFWSVMAFLEEQSPWRALQCGVLNALLVLAYVKIAVLLAPMLLAFVAWIAMTRAHFSLPSWRNILFCLAVFFVLAVLPNLPAMREMQLVAQFDFGPFAGWQNHYSTKTALSWIDRSSLLSGTPPSTQSFVSTPTSYLGLAGVLCVMALFFLRKRPIWLTEEATVFRLFVALALLSQWLGFGVHSALFGHLEFLRTADLAADPAIAISWGLLILQGVAIYMVMPGSLPGRPWWSGLAIAIYFLVPGFRLIEHLPLYGGLRAPHDFSEIPGVFCFAVAVGISARLLILQAPMRLAATTAALAIGLADAGTAVPSFWKGPMPQATYDDFVSAQKFLKEQPQAGRVFVYSGRYFYLLTPMLSGRGLATEAYNSHLMMVGVAQLLQAGQTSQENFLTYLNISGIRYILLDRTDPDLPAQINDEMRQVLPVVFENEYFSVLENKGSLAPAAFTHQHVLLENDGIGQEAALQSLAMARQGIAAVSQRSNFGDNLGQIFSPTEGSERAPFQLLAPDSFQRLNAQAITVEPPDQTGWLLLPEANHPDWKAFQNGNPLEIATAFCGYLAVRLTGETGTVELRFLPPAWYSIYLILSLLGWLTALVLLVVMRTRLAPDGFRTPRTWSNDPVIPPASPASAAGTNHPPVERVAVVIPTYKEARGIRAILDMTLDVHDCLDILVVDDASPDGTAELVRTHPAFGKRVHLLSRAGKLGLGSAYREGFQWAIDRDYDACAEMDADFSHNPGDLPKLIDALKGGADAAVGSRYLNGVRVINWPQDRLLLSLGASRFVRAVTRLPLSDATSGFKVLRCSLLRDLDWSRFKAEGYGFQIEMHYFLWKDGARIVEVPIVFTERSDGESKMSFGIALEALRRVLQLALTNK